MRHLWGARGPQVLDTSAFCIQKGGGNSQQGGFRRKGWKADLSVSSADSPLL